MVPDPNVEGVVFAKAPNPDGFPNADVVVLLLEFPKAEVEPNAEPLVPANADGEVVGLCPVA